MTISVQIHRKMGLDAIGRDLNRCPSDYKVCFTVAVGLAAYIKYAGVLVIEGKVDLVRIGRKTYYAAESQPTPAFAQERNFMLNWQQMLLLTQ